MTQDRKEYKKEWYQRNKEKHLANCKKYREENKDKVVEMKKEWLKNNPEKAKEMNTKKCKKWREINKEKHNEYYNTYVKTRRDMDSLFKLSGNIRNLTRMAFKRNGYKKGTKTEIIIGCSFEKLKNHLESKFEPWMSWHNYGLYNGELNYGWDIDHIMPLSSCNNQINIIKLGHYTNLQPLCSKVNRDIKINNIQ